MNDSEKNVMFHIAGMIVHKVAKYGAVCNHCIEKCISASTDCSFGTFTALKDFTGQALVYVNEDTFIFFLKLEIVFRSEIEHYTNEKMFDTIESQLTHIPAPHLILCHDLKPKKVHKNKLDSRSMAV